MTHVRSLLELVFSCKVFDGHEEAKGVYPFF